MLYVCTRLPVTALVCSNIALEFGWPDAIGLDNIPYSSSIKDFLNSWLINYDYWPYIIYVGLGYLTNYVVSNNFAIDITYLLSYCIILNHPITVFKKYAIIWILFYILSREGKWTQTLPSCCRWFFLCLVCSIKFDRLLAGVHFLHIESAYAIRPEIYVG